MEQNAQLTDQPTAPTAHTRKPPGPTSVSMVDRAPQVPLCAGDRDEHLIEVPFVAQPPTTTAQLVRVLGPEPVAPGPDRLLGHLDTTFEHQLRHVAQAQREPVLQPDAMADDLGRKP